MRPSVLARLAGAVYLSYFVTAVAGGLLAPGIAGPGPAPDGPTLANTIAAHASTYELAVALGLVSTALYVALAGLFYHLFRPVSRALAVLMAFFSLVGCALTGLGAVFQLAPVALLDGDSYLKVFSAEQLQAQALLFLNLNGQAGRAALVFFGCFQLFLGYLIVRSRFLPWIIGVLIGVAGVGWLTVLSPALPGWLLTGEEVLGFAAEAALMLWLLVIGVSERRWTELQARQPAAP